MTEKRTPKTYKQLVLAISGIYDWDSLCQVEGEIDFSYQHDKITWTDHETLYRICDGLSHAAGVPDAGRR